MVAAYAPTPYTVIVEFNTESYWNLHLRGYDEIIPKHVFEEIEPNDWQTYQPDPPATEWVTSGPFNVTEYIAGEFTELTYNHNHFFVVERTSGTPTPTSIDGGGEFTMMLIVGALGASVVILVGGYVLLRRT
ncbi:MAG: hypothetical protein P1Q69_06790 [Candidatus Thorarchaeota archaeon]|nr:hypothetical protein [Candidatus Thorarchaeota archaeon]